MMTVRIRKHSNVYIEVVADASDRMGLSERFCFFAPNYRFHPKFKAGVWDGKIRLFKYSTGLIYAGLLPDVVEYLRECGSKISIDPEVFDMFRSQATNAEIDLWLKDQKIHAHGEEIFPHDYQVDALKLAIKTKRLIFRSPTSSGKSLIIYLIAKFIYERMRGEDEQILIVVPNLNLINQLKADFKDYSVLNGFDVEKIVGQFDGGRKQIDRSIVISTWQSIYDKPVSWFENFCTAMVDEVHEAKAKSLISIMEKCNAEFRFGLTGSLPPDLTDRITLKGLYGPVKTMTTTKALQERGIVSKLEIMGIVIEHNKEDFKKGMDYPSEIEALAGNEKRNQFICDLADKLDGNVLVLFTLVEKHGKKLYKMAKETCDKEIFFVHGGVAADEREKIRQILETHKGAIIFASYKTFSTGVSVRNLHNIILASPTKSFTRVVQSIGRGLRISSTKILCKLFDIGDYIRGKDESSWNFAMRHFRERLLIYRAEKHEYTVEKVKL